MREAVESEVDQRGATACFIDVTWDKADREDNSCCLGTASVLKSKGEGHFDFKDSQMLKLRNCYKIEKYTKCFYKWLRWYCRWQNQSRPPTDCIPKETSTKPPQSLFISREETKLEAEGRTEKLSNSNTWLALYEENATDLGGGARAADKGAYDEGNTTLLEQSSFSLDHFNKMLHYVSWTSFPSLIYAICKK